MIGFSMEIVLLGSCSRHVYRIEFVSSILNLDEFGYLLVCVELVSQDR